MAVAATARTGPPTVSRRATWLVLVAVAWLATRGLVLWLLLDRHAWVRGDLAYFASSLAALEQEGLARTLVEYPLPGVLVVAVPWLGAELSGGVLSYEEVVLGLSLAADAAYTLLLAWAPRRGRGAAVAVWLLAVPALGATTYARFDLVPALLVGVAILLLPVRPGLAAAAAALATGLKLWAAPVLPALAAPARSRRRVVTTVVVTGGMLAVTSLVVGGWSRLVSPFTWQADRGLQIEAVAATPAMLGWAGQPGRYEVAMGPYNAFEVVGPGVGELLLVSELASLALAPLLVWLWFRAWRGPRRVEVETVAWLALAAVTAFMVTSKVLSPQYVVWLLPAAAAGVAVGGRGLRAWAGLLLLTAALTQLVFPELYGHVIAHGELSRRAVLVLATRNLALVALAAWALAVSWRRTARVPLP